MTSDFPELHNVPLCASPPLFHWVAGDKEDLLEIEGQCSRIRQKNTYLEDTLEKGEVEIHELFQETALLQEKNKRLQKAIAQLPDLKKMVKNLNFKIMRNKLEAELDQQSKNEKFENYQHETLVLKKEITIRKNQIIDQEDRLEKKKLEQEEIEELAHKRESIKKYVTTTLKEYATAIEVLNNKMDALQTKVEESFQEISLRNAIDECSRKSAQSPVDGTFMHELIQVKLDEDQLLKAEQQKDWGFWGQKLLYAIMLKVLWYNIKVFFFSGFFILLLNYLLPLSKGNDPGYLGWFIRSVFSSEAVESIENILQPCLQRLGSGVVPT
ncbi:uncharacterized protein LOC143794005 isoform X3 [Ranitomeya variabilis]|uniref:uncharacterized protein LOC143794005 isoform X3 n=1 Tax=Ranitomeya variabilis TaxID=490064 RepID=UPI0040576372